jgi:cytochrome c peroxidase
VLLDIEAEAVMRERAGHPWPRMVTRRVIQGAVNFFRPFPGGNGRSCATCHNPRDGFSLSSTDIPQLRGINHTAPYFHDHRAKTLEEVVEHYQSFFFFLNVVRGFPLPLIADEDIDPIVAYMKKAL